MSAFNMPNSRSALAHISAFRLRKFGLGPSNELVNQNPLAKDLQGAISALSTDLYAKHTHFIFELIQNAEDNSYATGVVPSLSFHLCRNDPTQTEAAQGALIVQNNEIGFSSEQVEAICSVGSSTKRKAQGFIGEKGIGFKSVFRVTSNPHIISNGYAFHLPERHSVTGLGYIVPCWLEKLPELDDLSHTTIILPLDKPDITFELIEGFLRQIVPETILFLSKLCDLRVSIDGEYDAVIRKDGTDSPLVTLTFSKTDHNKSEEQNLQCRYWALTRSFQRPAEVTAERRDDVLTSEVTVAFPLDDSSRSTGRLFAYLPVYEDSGLPVLLNADFLLAASREAVKEDEPWNKWLRECVTELYVEAFGKLVRHPQYRELAYSFIPLSANHIFLQPIVDHVIGELSELTCVWCQEPEQYSRPSTTLMCGNPFRALVHGEALPSTLRTRPLVNVVIQRWHAQLSKIGVTWLQYDAVVESLRDTAWLSARPKEWFSDLYDYLMEHRNDLVGLETCPIVRVDGERLSCDAEQPIYFFCDAETRSLLDSIPSHMRVPHTFLSPNVYALVGKKAGLREWMTEALRVYDFSRANYAVDFVSWLAKNLNSVTDSELVKSTQFLATFTRP